VKGHIRERSPGRWAIIIETRNPATGRRKPKWHSFKGTKRQAQIECARLIAAHESGLEIESTKTTVGDFLARFERDWLRGNVSARTAQRYRECLKQVRARLGGTALQKLHPVHLSTVYADLLRDGLAPRAVGHVHRVLRRALGQVQQWGEVKDNVGSPCPLPACPRRRLLSCSPRRRTRPWMPLRASPCT
jgi:hypothetical protein